MKIDLGFGNPSFLSEYWRGLDLPDIAAYYPDPYMSEKQNPFLEQEIRNIHKAVGNVLNVDDYSIVIGNGASQLLSAILYETPDVFVTAPIPYFLRFPVLAQIGGNQWSHKEKFKTILTIPNNPTGSFDEYHSYKMSTKGTFTITDACYNWPQYLNGRKVIELADDIILFSLSKATGHAGTRLGWALIKNPELANDVKRSVEMTTMGVSALSQEVGRFVLQREAKRFSNGDDTCFSYGLQVLTNRWAKLREMELPFKILNDRGMFLWCEGEIPGHVEGIRGDRFGDSIKKFRLNIGCSSYDFAKFVGHYEKDDFQLED